VVRRDDLWLPMRQVRHSLPAERDAFVGRHDALAELARRFDAGARLVSVLGIGGVGKTRLATHFAWTWLGDYPGGAWFCDLSQARGIDGIVQGVAQGLDVPLGMSDPLQQLGHAIAGRGPCLVILDNFEQVARHAADTLGRWLDRAAEARFLVTTREVLGLPGEEALALAPLGMPDAQDLFERRAAAVDSDYLPGAEKQGAVPQLVKLLDGLPLAIELAAARVRFMSPKALLARMDKRFKLLAAQGGRQDRQATLRATFDWSWDLLNDAEKSTLAQLSVFVGGFTLKSAEAVVELSAVAGPQDVLDLLQSLVDKSFVHRVGDLRFDLLVSVQEYAAEQLAKTGTFAGSGPQAAIAAGARHATFYSSQDLNAPLTASAELQNCVAACRRAEALGDCELAVALLERAWTGYQQKGPFHAAADLSLSLLAMPEMRGQYRARVSWVAGSALQHAGKNAAAYEHLVAAAAHFDDCNDRPGYARALRRLADLDLYAGRPEQAGQRAGVVLSIGFELSDGAIEIDALTSLGNIEERIGHVEDAHRSLERAIARAREIGDRRREGAALGNLALLCSDQGKMGEALSHHEAALAAARETDNPSLQGNALCNLGLLHQFLGDSSAAQARLEQALEVARHTGNALLEAAVLCNLGIVLEATAHSEAAQGRYEAALALARVLGDGYMEGQFLGYLGLLHARKSRHAEARHCLERGQIMLEATKDKVGLAVLICGLAEAEQLAGNHSAARAAYRTAKDIADSIGAGRDSELGLSLARLVQLLDLYKG
jgi:predicted ATPase